jgi:hydroxymethylglutaryl-CoA reductase
MTKLVSGFSKLSKNEKIDWLTTTYLNGNESAKDTILQYWNNNEKLQNLHDDFIENTISNFYLPLGIAPNFDINGRIYTIPMVIEESSVVAAASKAAKFWEARGGFKTEVISTEKIGQVHFTYSGKFEELQSFFNTIKPQILEDSKAITKNMEKRGGGILDIILVNKTKDLKDYYQLHATFETLDAMGANFINSCLEQFATTLKNQAHKLKGDLNVVMSILSNYVPNCLVKASVSCKVEELADKGINAEEFAEKFVQAVNIAKIEPYRAVTHNKGIMNGIDAVVLATGNDFRAIEAGVHAYASKDGRYSSLTHAKVENGVFTFWIELPLALGTVGGLTKLHPLVKLALDILDNPSAKELMQIVAVAGLAQNFGALRSLTTTGIQEGHMKMHLMNILNQFEATKEEKSIIVEQFKTETVTHSAVVNAIEGLRK